MINLLPQGALFNATHFPAIPWSANADPLAEHPKGTSFGAPVFVSPVIYYISTVVSG